MAVGVWRWGVTPGKLVMRLRVTRSDGGRVGLGRSLLRESLLYPSVAFALLGAFFPGLYDATWFGMGNLVIWLISAILVSRPRRQAIHDRILGTIVILARRRPRPRRAPMPVDQGRILDPTSRAGDVSQPAARDHHRRLVLGAAGSVHKEELMRSMTGMLDETRSEQNVDIDAVSSALSAAPNPSGRPRCPRA